MLCWRLRTEYTPARNDGRKLASSNTDRWPPYCLCQPAREAANRVVRPSQEMGGGVARGTEAKADCPTHPNKLRLVLVTMRHGGPVLWRCATQLEELQGELARGSLRAGGRGSSNQPGVSSRLGGNTVRNLQMAKRVCSLVSCSCQWARG